MGCDCAKMRERVEEEDRSTLARWEVRAGRQERRSLKVPSTPDQSDPIKRLYEPLATLYELGECVKQSSTCRLVKARYIGTDQLCFVKVMPKSKQSLLQQRTKLASEVEKLRLLDHPYILRVLEVMQDQENFYVVMEAFAGGQLSDYIGNARVCSEHTLARIVLQVLQTLRYCHHMGVIHGNLSLRSLVFPQDVNSCVKVLGFGEADEVPREEGCPADDSHFCAPERNSGQSEKCDIWSCGVVLYALLSGEGPFGPLNKCVATPRRTAHFSASHWSGKSNEVVALLGAMLESDSSRRASTDQCLTHRWLTAHCKPTAVSPGTMKKHLFALKRCRLRNELQQATLAFTLRRVVKEKEVQPLIDPFFVLDSNNDGVLSCEELHQAFLLILSEEDALVTSQKIFAAMDLNSNGSISYTEYLISALGEKQLLSMDCLKRVFRCLDRAGNGNVPLRRIIEFFFVKGSAEKERHLQDLLQQASRAADGTINFEEFTVLMTNINPA